MLKTILFVSAAIVSVPTLAQDQTQPASQSMTTAPAPAAPAQTTPPVSTEAPVAETPSADVAPVDPAAAAGQSTPPAAPAATTTPAAPASAAANPAPAASATPVTGATQIAQVVDTEFPTYDKNADSSLNRTEFGAWMVALKTASDPATKAADPATVKWVDGAFASADADKSKAVSKAELTTYLSQGAE